MHSHVIVCVARTAAFRAVVGEVELLGGGFAGAAEEFLGPAHGVADAGGDLGHPPPLGAEEEDAALEAGELAERAAEGEDAVIVRDALPLGDGGVAVEPRLFAPVGAAAVAHRRDGVAAGVLDRDRFGQETGEDFLDDVFRDVFRHAELLLGHVAQQGVELAVEIFGQHY